MNSKQQSIRRATLKKCADLMRFRRYSINTERDYCGIIGSYVDWLAVHGAALPDSRTQIAYAKAMWQRDRDTGLPVEVPGLLARKYPKAPQAWMWFWLFPAHAPCNHPRTGKRVRWRMHEVNVQRAVRQAAEKLGLDGLATPHVLRHCCATHVLDAGTNISDVQELLGHSHLNTTMIYVHGDGERVRSPLDVPVPMPANVVPFEADAAGRSARAPVERRAA